MLDIFRFILSIFGDFIGFLDSFYIFESLSFLKLFFILSIFYIGLNFLFKNKNKE